MWMVNIVEAYHMIAKIRFIVSLMYIISHTVNFPGVFKQINKPLPYFFITDIDIQKSQNNPCKFDSRTTLLLSFWL